MKRHVNVSYTEDEMREANMTCRIQVGGSRPIIPRIIASMAKPADAILDFGAGRYGAQADGLRGLGFNVIAHDFGANVVPGLHDPDALERTYDVVYASNVLNVQTSVAMLRKTLTVAASLLNDGGRFIANYPDKPRKAGLSNDAMREELQRRFGSVVELSRADRLGYAYQVFVCANPSED